MSDSEALVRQDAVKVEKWCTEQGIESPADLAFFFLSYEEALNGAGRAVADAWKAVRATSGGGGPTGRPSSSRQNEATAFQGKAHGPGEGAARWHRL